MSLFFDLKKAQSWVQNVESDEIDPAFIEDGDSFFGLAEANTKLGVTLTQEWYDECKAFAKAQHG